MPDEVRRVVAAAVQLGDEIHTLPPPKRHHHVLWKMDADGLNAMDPAQVQGFIDQAGQFLDRLEAANVAIAAGQIDALQWPPRLFSEDLW